MDITLKICETEEEWENALEKCPHATIFHKWKFLKIMEKHSKMNLLWSSEAKFHPLIGVHKKKPVGILPLFSYKTPILKAVFSPPLNSEATYMGPLIIEEEKLSQRDRENTFFEFIKAVDEYISTNFNANLIKIRTAPGILDVRSFIWNNYKVEVQYNYEIDISVGCERIWDKFEPNLRRSIKKASSAGISFEEGTKEDIKHFFSNLQKRYAEQKLKPNIDLTYLIETYEEFSNKNLKFFAAKKDRNFLSGIILLTYKEKAVAWIGAHKTDSTEISPNDLIIWESIKWASENKYKTFEITWANTQRLCKYKAKFNPKASPYFSCEKHSKFVSILYKIEEIKKILLNT